MAYSQQLDFRQGVLGYIYHPDCLLHKSIGEHPERPERIEVIERALKNSPLNQHVEYFEAPMATEADILRVHNQDYVESILQGAPKAGCIYLDPDTYMNQHSLKAAMLAAGAVIKAVDLVVSKQYKRVFCNVRPPGHHAEKERAMGFCIFNNIAVGVAYALAVHGLKKIAIVDFDVHHGNGTEDIFSQDKRVLYCSSFQHPFYPGSGWDTQNEHIINIPLPAYTKGASFRRKITELWLEPITSFQADIIFFSAGFDGHAADAMANFLLTDEDYVWLTQQINSIATAQNCPIISVLEGGYNLATLGQTVLSHLVSLHGD